MESNTLNIIIDTEGRKFFENFNQKIVLIRAIEINSKFQIVCASFSPFSKKSIITFYDEWMLYVTKDHLQDDTVIVYEGQTKANLGQVYNYETIGWKPGIGTTQPSEILVNNNRSQPNSLGFGLSQNIDIGNGQGPKYRSLSIGEYPYNQSFNFIPTNELWILPASGLSDNMLSLTSSFQPTNALLETKSNTLGKYLSIEIGKTKTVHFDNKMHMFQKGPLSKKS